MEQDFHGNFWSNVTWFLVRFERSRRSAQATILVTNRWNRHHFSRIFWRNPEIYTSHCFSHWHVPSPFPMLSHAYFEALRPLWYPNQRWGRGKRHKCFKIFDEYCSWQSCPWSLKLMTSQVVEGTWICTGGYRRFRGEWVKSKRFFES